MTVPGMAKESIVPNSNRLRPANRCRASRYAVRMPIAAVIGAEMAAIWIVVQKESTPIP